MSIISKTHIKYWPLRILLIIASGVLLGYLSSFAIGTQWESESFIEGGTINAENLESVDLLTLRLRSARTFTGVAQRIYPEYALLPAVRDLRAATRIIQTPQGIILKIKANNADDTVRISHYFLDELRRQQSKLISVRSEQMDFKLQQERLVTNRSGRACSTTKNATVKIMPAHFTIEPSYFPNPISPSRQLLMFVGGLAGICLGLILARRKFSPEITAERRICND